MPQSTCAYHLVRTGVAVLRHQRLVQAPNAIRLARPPIPILKRDSRLDYIFVRIERLRLLRAAIHVALSTTL